ncbi:DUF4333 domain-containing protein [Mycolicibacterium stellerae]|uniref:DUF4333 domain-containing protein n=1 Tax=Mycolicibacterium stellerae TaxID=2358193 RepID=UPI000F0B5E33|nr:DUF4333 domain-containing protein [Mycolicibacterium stellerae]
MHPSTAVVAAAALFCCVSSGCSVNSGGTNVPTVSRTALQEDIAERLADAGEKPDSVICKQDLIGEVGTTAHCEIVVNPTNSFEPIVTVTAVDGAAIDYQMAPAVSRQQLEQVVSRLIADSGVRDVRTVLCESGMEGTVGAVGHCDVDAGGSRSQRTVEVSGVSGLMMNLELVPLDATKVSYNYKPTS